MTKTVKVVVMKKNFFVTTPTLNSETLTPSQKPSQPCTNCKSDNWWLRQGEWICGRCHPNPNIEKEGHESIVRNEG